MKKANGIYYRVAVGGRSLESPDRSTEINYSSWKVAGDSEVVFTAMLVV